MTNIISLVSFLPFIILLWYIKQAFVLNKPVKSRNISLFSYLGIGLSIVYMLLYILYVASTITQINATQIYYDVDIEIYDVVGLWDIIHILCMIGIISAYRYICNSVKRHEYIHTSIKIFQIFSIIKMLNIIYETLQLFHLTQTYDFIGFDPLGLIVLGLHIIVFIIIIVFSQTLKKYI